MSRATKIRLIIATSLIALGLVMFVAAVAACDWDFTKLSSVKYETNTYEVSEEFSGIKINADTENILFAPSEDGKCKVVCLEEENFKHSVAVQDGILTVDGVDERKWHERLMNFGEKKISVYLPSNEYASLLIKSSTGDIEIPNNLKFESIDVSVSTGDLKNYASATKDVKMTTSTGDILVENISAASLNLSVSTGKVTVKNAACELDIKISVSTGRTNISDTQCKNLISSGSTGDISLKNVIAEEKFNIKRSTGDVKLDSCDAAEIFIETSTGDVSGSLLSPKVFIANTDTGEKDIPDTVIGGRCEITTDTGDIEISIN